MRVGSYHVGFEDLCFIKIICGDFRCCCVFVGLKVIVAKYMNVQGTFCKKFNFSFVGLWLLSYFALLEIKPK